MATQSPNDDYVPWKRRSSRRRSRKQTLQKNSFSNFQEKTKTGNLPVARANERDKVEIPSWNFENECFSRDESKWKRGTKIRQLLRSTWVGSHWRWPEQTTTTDFERCSQFVCCPGISIPSSNTNKKYGMWTTDPHGWRIVKNPHFVDCIE